MRQVEFGHWHYLLWHLPAVILTVAAVGLVVVTARSLARERYCPATRGLRWQILGWSAIGAALMSGVAWPYLKAASRLTVDGGGAWHLSNYLGVPLAEIPATEVRALRGTDLGGVGVGMGHLEIRRSDGSVVRTVRMSREVLDDAYRALGYPASMVHDECGDESVQAHRYGPAGPDTRR